MDIIRITSTLMFSLIFNFRRRHRDEYGSWMDVNYDTIVNCFQYLSTRKPHYLEIVNTYVVMDDVNDAHYTSLLLTILTRNEPLAKKKELKMWLMDNYHKLSNLGSLISLFVQNPRKQMTRRPSLRFLSKLFYLSQFKPQVSIVCLLMLSKRKVF